MWRPVRPVLDHDLADTESLQPRHRAFRRWIAPQNGLIIEGRQCDVDALERLHEDGTRARQISFPAGGTKNAVKGDLGALLPRNFERRKQTAKTVIGIQRQRDAGKVDQSRRNKAMRDAHPVGKLKQFARWRAVAPNAADGFAGLAMLDQGQRRQAARYAQNEISRALPPRPMRQCCLSRDRLRPQWQNRR